MIERLNTELKDLKFALRVFGLIGVTILPFFTLGMGVFILHNCVMVCLKSGLQLWVSAQPQKRLGPFEQ